MDDDEVGVPRTIAGRVEWVTRMLGGERILDEDGNDTGELTPRLISPETAKRLLNCGKEGRPDNG